jgi:hypothetical protein
MPSSDATDLLLWTWEPVPNVYLTCWRSAEDGRHYVAVDDTYRHERLQSRAGGRLLEHGIIQALTVRPPEAPALDSMFEGCKHQQSAPKAHLEQLPEAQAGTGRHRCVVCAYAMGLTEGEAKADRRWSHNARLHPVASPSPRALEHCLTWLELEILDLKENANAGFVGELEQLHDRLKLAFAVVTEETP